MTSAELDRKSTRLNSSHEWISYAVFCLKKKNIIHQKGKLGVEGSLLARLRACESRGGQQRMRRADAISHGDHHPRAQRLVEGGGARHGERLLGPEVSAYGECEQDLVHGRRKLLD